MSSFRNWIRVFSGCQARVSSPTLHRSFQDQSQMVIPPRAWGCRVRPRNKALSGVPPSSASESRATWFNTNRFAHGTFDQPATLRFEWSSVYAADPIRSWFYRNVGGKHHARPAEAMFMAVTNPQPSLALYLTCAAANIQTGGFAQRLWAAFRTKMIRDPRRRLTQ